MYSKYFGLEDMPFSIAPDPRYLYMSEQHREALAHLLYGFNSDGGFVLLTGEVGTGKTTVCRCLLEQAPVSSAIAFILNPRLTVEELLATICDELRIDYPADSRSIKVFVDQINTFLLDAHAKGQKVVLIIDEAQNLSFDVLEQLRLLTNLETNKQKLLQIILIGQPELKEKLSKPELKQLSQRIIARYHLDPLSRKDVKAYIRHRLSVAGIKKELFNSSIIEKIYNISGGVPRLINLVCDRALLGTFVQGKESVNSPILKKAANEVLGETAPSLKHNSAYLWVLTVLVITVAVLVFAATSNNYTPEDTVEEVIVQNLPEVSEVPVATEADKPVWPDDLPVEKNKEIALKTLFELWGKTSDAEVPTPVCKVAIMHGLSCLISKGNLGSLRRIDRPAVLKFIDNEKGVFYAALTHLEDETATLVFGGKTIKVSTYDIEARWTGNYTLLWKMPPGYNGNIKPGDSGPAVTWLTEQLSFILGETVLLNEKNVFDSELANKVKEFQRSAGLVSDGIAGRRTLIRINYAIGGNMPTLTEKKET